MGGLYTNKVDLKGENGKTKNYQGMWVLPASLQGGFGGIRKNSHVHDLDLCWEELYTNTHN